VNEKTGLKFDPKKDGQFLPVDAFMEKPMNPKALIETAKKLLALKKDQINLAGT
jgi:hypothetical protein